MADDAEAARPKAKETRTDEEDTEDNGSGKREESEKWALSEEQRAACKTMFEKLTLYLNGELTSMWGLQRSVLVAVKMLLLLLQRGRVCSTECMWKACKQSHIIYTYMLPSYLRSCKVTWGNSM